MLKGVRVKLVWWFPLASNKPIEVAISEENVLLMDVGGHKAGLRIKHFGVSEDDCLRRHLLWCRERAAFFVDRVERLSNE